MTDSSINEALLGLPLPYREAVVSHFKNVSTATAQQAIATAIASLSHAFSPVTSTTPQNTTLSQSRGTSVSTFFSPQRPVSHVDTLGTEGSSHMCRHECAVHTPGRDLYGVLQSPSVRSITRAVRTPLGGNRSRSTSSERSPLGARVVFTAAAGLRDPASTVAHPQDHNTSTFEGADGSLTDASALGSLCCAQVPEHVSSSARTPQQLEPHSSEGALPLEDVHYGLHVNGAADTTVSHSSPSNTIGCLKMAPMVPTEMLPLQEESRSPSHGRTGADTERLVTSAGGIEDTSPSNVSVDLITGGIEDTSPSNVSVDLITGGIEDTSPSNVSVDLITSTNLTTGGIEDTSPSNVSVDLITSTNLTQLQGRMLSSSLLSVSDGNRAQQFGRSSGLRGTRRKAPCPSDVAEPSAILSSDSPVLAPGELSGSRDIRNPPAVPAITTPSGQKVDSAVAFSASTIASPHFRTPTSGQKVDSAVAFSASTIASPHFRTPIVGHTSCVADTSSLGPDTTCPVSRPMRSSPLAHAVFTATCALAASRTPSCDTRVPVVYRDKLSRHLTEHSDLGPLWPKSARPLTAYPSCTLSKSTSSRQTSPFYFHPSSVPETSQKAEQCRFEDKEPRPVLPWRIESSLPRECRAGASAGPLTSLLGFGTDVQPSQVTSTQTSASPPPMSVPGQCPFLPWHTDGGPSFPDGRPLVPSSQSNVARSASSEPLPWHVTSRAVANGTTSVTAPSPTGLSRLGHEPDPVAVPSLSSPPEVPCSYGRVTVEFRQPEVLQEPQSVTQFRVSGACSALQTSGTVAATEPKAAGPMSQGEDLSVSTERAAAAVSIAALRSALRYAHAVQTKVRCTGES